jgi:hypothetical protein
MDLTKLSDSDLIALHRGDLSKVSNDGLKLLVAAQNQTSKPALPETNYSPTEGMSGPERFLAGLGKSLHDIGQGAGQALGLVKDTDVAETKKYDAALMKTGAGMAGNLTGNLGLGAATMAIPGANTFVGGALTGAALGALEPTAGNESRAKNALAGGVFGSAIPAALNLGKAAKSIFYDPLAAQNKIIGGALTKVSGQDAEKVAEALRNAAPGATPGVKLSAATISGNPGLAALEDALRNVVPNGELNRSALANRAALADALRGIAKTPEDMAAALAERGAKAEQLYGKARAEGIDLASLTPEAKDRLAKFQQNMQSRIPEEISNKAKKISEIEGVPMDNSTSIEYMHFIKKAIDSEISKAKVSGDKDLAKAYSGLQETLLNGMGEFSKSYDTARQTFSKMSDPINQMELGQALANKLIPSTAGDIPASLNYAGLATAMRNPDRLAQQATKFSGAKMENVLTPEQLSTVKGVTSDASKIAEALKLGMGEGPATARRLTQNQMIPMYFAEQAPITSKILSLVGKIPGADVAGKLTSMAASTVGNKLEQNMIRNMEDMLANNPQQVAQLISKELSRLEPSQRMQIIKALPQSVALAMPSMIRSNDAAQ